MGCGSSIAIDAIGRQAGKTHNLQMKTDDGEIISHKQIPQSPTSTYRKGIDRTDPMNQGVDCRTDHPRDGNPTGQQNLTTRQSNTTHLSPNLVIQAEPPRQMDKTGSTGLSLSERRRSVLLTAAMNSAMAAGSAGRGLTVNPNNPIVQMQRRMSRSSNGTPLTSSETASRVQAVVGRRLSTHGGIPVNDQLNSSTVLRKRGSQVIIASKFIQNSGNGLNGNAGGHRLVPGCGPMQQNGTSLHATEVRETASHQEPEPHMITEADENGWSSPSSPCTEYEDRFTRAFSMTRPPSMLDLDGEAHRPLWSRAGELSMASMTSFQSLGSFSSMSSSSFRSDSSSNIRRGSGSDQGSDGHSGGVQIRGHPTVPLNGGDTDGPQNRTQSNKCGTTKSASFREFHRKKNLRAGNLIQLHGMWISGCTGGPPTGKLFFRNPQFFIRVPESDSDMTIELDVDPVSCTVAPTEPTGPSVDGNFIKKRDDSSEKVPLDPKTESDSCRQHADSKNVTLSPIKDTNRMKLAPKDIENNAPGNSGSTQNRPESIHSDPSFVSSSGSSTESSSSGSSYSLNSFTSTLSMQPNMSFRTGEPWEPLASSARDNPSSDHSPTKGGNSPVLNRQSQSSEPFTDTTAVKSITPMIYVFITWNQGRPVQDIQPEYELLYVSNPKMNQSTSWSAGSCSTNSKPLTNTKTTTKKSTEIGNENANEPTVATTDDGDEAVHSQTREASGELVDGNNRVDECSAVCTKLTIPLVGQRAILRCQLQRRPKAYLVIPAPLERHGAECAFRMTIRSSSRVVVRIPNNLVSSTETKHTGIQNKLLLKNTSKVVPSGQSNEMSSTNLQKNNAWSAEGSTSSHPPDTQRPRTAETQKGQRMQKVTEMQGRWHGFNAGGSLGCPRWRFNPSYPITVPNDALLRVTVERTDLKNDSGTDRNDSGSHPQTDRHDIEPAGFVIVKEPGARTCSHLEPHPKMIVAHHGLSRSPVLCRHIVAPKSRDPYIVIPFLRTPKSQGAFRILVESDERFSVESVTDEQKATQIHEHVYRGSWMGGATGGDREDWTFSNNPTFTISSETEFECAINLTQVTDPWTSLPSAATDHSSFEGGDDGGRTSGGVRSVSFRRCENETRILLYEGDTADETSLICGSKWRRERHNAYQCAMDAGQYTVVVTTRPIGVESEFLLRITSNRELLFTEKSVDLSEGQLNSGKWVNVDVPRAIAGEVPVVDMHRVGSRATRDPSTNITGSESEQKIEPHITVINVVDVRGNAMRELNDSWKAPPGRNNPIEPTESLTYQDTNCSIKFSDWEIHRFDREGGGKGHADTQEGSAMSGLEEQSNGHGQTPEVETPGITDDEDHSILSENNINRHNVHQDLKQKLQNQIQADGTIVGGADSWDHSCGQSSPQTCLPLASKFPPPSEKIKYIIRLKVNDNPGNGYMFYARACASTSLEFAMVREHNSWRLRDMHDIQDWQQNPHLICCGRVSNQNRRKDKLKRDQMIVRRFRTVVPNQVCWIFISLIHDSGIDTRVSHQNHHHHRHHHNHNIDHHQQHQQQQQQHRHHDTIIYNDQSNRFAENSQQLIPPTNGPEKINSDADSTEITNRESPTAPPMHPSSPDTGLQKGSECQPNTNESPMESGYQDTPSPSTLLPRTRGAEQNSNPREGLMRGDRQPNAPNGLEMKYYTSNEWGLEGHISNWIEKIARSVEPLGDLQLAILGQRNEMKYSFS